MTQQSTAVAKREEPKADIALPLHDSGTSVTRGDVTMTPAVVRIPKHHQYKISIGRTQDADGSWRDAYRVGVTADGYDNVNRVVGAQFIVPEYIHDEKGERVRNPIHRADYIYMRLIAIWYNDLGQMQAYSEDLEVDYKILYQQARLNATWDDETIPEVQGKGGKKYRPKAKALDHTIVLRDKDGRAILGPDGTPQFDVVLPDHVEARCIQRLYDLRVTGMRYAQTVLKNRLMKVVTGIRMLPIDSPRDCTVSVMAYRDDLTPTQRVERAQLEQRQVFGKALQPGSTLTDEELNQTELDPGLMDKEPDADLADVRNVTPDAEGDEEPPAD